DAVRRRRNGVGNRVVIEPAHDRWVCDRGVGPNTNTGERVGYDAHAPRDATGVRVAQGPLQRIELEVQRDGRVAMVELQDVSRRVHAYRIKRRNAPGTVPL